MSIQRPFLSFHYILDDNNDCHECLIKTGHDITAASKKVVSFLYRLPVDAPSVPSSPDTAVAVAARPQLGDICLQLHTTGSFSLLSVISWAPGTTSAQLTTPQVVMSPTSSALFLQALGAGDQPKRLAKRWYALVGAREMHSHFGIATLGLVASNPRPREKPSKAVQRRGLTKKAGARVDRPAVTVEQAGSASIGAIGGQLPASNVQPPPPIAPVVGATDTPASVHYVVTPAPSPSGGMPSSASPATNTAAGSAAPPHCNAASPSPATDGSVHEVRNPSFFRLVTLRSPQGPQGPQGSQGGSSWAMSNHSSASPSSRDKTIGSFFKQCPLVMEQLLASGNKPYCLFIAQRPVQESAPFIPALFPRSKERSLTSIGCGDRLLLEAIFDQGPQGIHILHSLIIARRKTTKNNTIKWIFGDVADVLIILDARALKAGDVFRAKAGVEAIVIEDLHQAKIVLPSRARGEGITMENPNEQACSAEFGDLTVKVNPRHFGVYMDPPPNINLNMSYGTSGGSTVEAAKGSPDAQAESKAGQQANIATVSGDEGSRKPADVPKEVTGGTVGCNEGIYFTIKEDGSIAPSTADGADAF
ncbi:hypothetical protein K488DRAFT_89765 [Vararia minispora EC-137]|uniref:Uncharacterized protein n=1 Tax=Vararia minispora EC-137 TaxID=1314806 RepID=A0ACB8Q9Q1_9AGAM|nr:hypothetical protein K488DRAFT_89765 [Vararia minispora EC-137]